MTRIAKFLREFETCYSCNYPHKGVIQEPDPREIQARIPAFHSIRCIET